MGARGAPVVLALLLAWGGLAPAQESEVPPPAAEVLQRVVERYSGLQTLEVEGKLLVTKRALGLEEKVEATYSLLFRRPMDLLYQLVWKMEEAGSREKAAAQEAETRHTLQCFGGVVRDYYESFRFEDGSMGEALVLTDLPETLKALDLSPLLERVLLGGLENEEVQEAVYAGPGGLDFYEIAFDSVGAPTYEGGPQPRAHVTLRVQPETFLLKGYGVEAVAPGAVRQSSLSGEYEVTDLVIIVEALPKKTLADQQVDDNRFVFAPPRSARVIDQRSED